MECPLAAEDARSTRMRAWFACLDGSVRRERVRVWKRDSGKKQFVVR